MFRFWHRRSSDDVPAPALSAMQRGDQYELLSLDPSRRVGPAPNSFHGWHVLGRTSIGDGATRRKLTKALRAGTRDYGGVVAMCFIPRHGIHVIHGAKVHDLVICFECQQVRIFEDGRQGMDFLVSHSPQRVFDEVLRAAGVPLAEPSA